MSDWDDHDFGVDVEWERRADEEHERAISDALSDRERDEDERRRSHIR
jgi:hypothetical protein